MAVIQELIRLEDDGTLSFGNYLLDLKDKVSEFEVEGDIYKLKTFKDITRLDRNGIFVYESIPGTTVHSFKLDGRLVSFNLESYKDTNITLELEPRKIYKIYIDDVQVDKVKTNLSGKV